MAPGGLPRHPGEPSGTVLRVRNSERALFECDLSRDSIENRIRDDFRSIIEACAQTPNLDFEATLWCFLRFFTNRIVFARVGQLERKDIGKARKSIPWKAQNRSKIDKNRSSEPSLNDVSRLSRSKMHVRATEIAQERHESAPKAAKERPRVPRGAVGCEPSANPTHARRNARGLAGGV